jgi:hypothetical protein
VRATPAGLAQAQPRAMPRAAELHDRFALEQVLCVCAPAPSRAAPRPAAATQTDHTLHSVLPHLRCLFAQRLHDAQQRNAELWRSAASRTATRAVVSEDGLPTCPSEAYAPRAPSTDRMGANGNFRGDGASPSQQVHLQTMGTSGVGGERDSRFHGSDGEGDAMVPRIPGFDD